MSDQTRNTKDSVQVCSILHVAHVVVGVVSLLSLSTMVSMKELKVYLSLYTLLRSHLCVNSCIGRYSLYNPPSVTVDCCQLLPI